MNDDIYREHLKEVDQLRSLIEACGMSSKLYVEFDSNMTEKFDFFFKPDYDNRIYSTGLKDKAEAFILGMHYGREMDGKWVV